MKCVTPRQKRYQMNEWMNEYDKENAPSFIIYISFHIISIYSFIFFIIFLQYFFLLFLAVFCWIRFAVIRYWIPENCKDFLLIFKTYNRISFFFSFSNSSFLLECLNNVRLKLKKIGKFPFAHFGSFDTSFIHKMKKENFVFHFYLNSIDT